MVVERAPQLRTAGQTVDIRGAGREVARRMDIKRTAREKLTREEGLAFVDSAGRTGAAFSADGFGDQGSVSEIEVLRSELVNINSVYEGSRTSTEYSFGD